MGFKDSKKENTPKSEQDSASYRDADFSALDDSEGLEPEAAGDSASAASGDSNGSGGSEMSALKAELEDTKDKYLRSLADFENYKKRALKERSELLKYQGDRIVYDLLEVLDNLELALSHADAEPEKLKAGLELIQKLFINVLGRWEIRAVTGLGKEFDPAQQQAISKIALDDTKPGTVINEFKKAYFYKDKLLRPADVVVSVAREGNASESDGAEEAEGGGSEADESAK